MGAAEVVGILVAIVAVGGVAWYLTTRRQRSEALRRRYGPEYSRTVSEVGSQRRAEEELLRRQERVELLEIRPLLAEQRQMFAQQWRGVQTMFVDDPGGAVRKADGLVEEVMKTRGYPVADFDQRTADLSVHHALLVQNYRAARDIAERYRRGAASTEDLRRSMVYYRELFKDLLEDRENNPERTGERPIERAIERPIERDVQRTAEATLADERARVDQQRTIRVEKDVRP